MSASLGRDTRAAFTDTVNAPTGTRETPSFNLQKKKSERIHFKIVLSK